MILSQEKAFEETGIDLKVSGMPYIRTLNANSITGEISLFYRASLLILINILLFFRSFRSTLIILIVVVGVMWTLDFLGYFISKLLY
jgi:predicted RND superfamily exporter protein